MPSPPPSPATPRSSAGRWAGSSIRSAAWACRCCRAPATGSRRRSAVPTWRCRSSTACPVASAQVKSAVLLAGLNVAGHHHRHRAGADARPYRADARGVRRRDRDRDRRGRGTDHPARRPRQPQAAEDRRAGRPQLGRLPDRRRPDRRRLRRDGRERAHEPDALRPGRDADRDGRRHHDRESPQHRRRGRRRRPGQGDPAQGHRRCRRRARRR